METQTTPVTELTQIVPQHPKSSKNTNWILLLALIVTLSFTAFFAYQNNRLHQQLNQLVSTQQPSGQNDQISPTPTHIASRPLIFKSYNELWQLSPDNKKTQLTQSNGGVVTYAQSPSTPHVAYIHGQKKSNTSGYTWIEPYQVFIINTETNKTTSIYSMAPSRPVGASLEFQDQLQDLSFSADGELLAITTSQSLFIYNTTNSTLTQIFSLPYEGRDTVSGIFSYSHPRFSPDKTKLLLKIGYFEGGSSMVVDLATKQTHLTNYLVGYDGGKTPIDWVNNQQFLIQDSSQVNQDQPTRTDLDLVTFPGFQEQTLVQILPNPGGIQQIFQSEDKTTYLLRQSYDPNTKTTSYLLDKLNTSTGEITQTASLLSNQPNQTVKQILTMSNNKIYFLVETDSTPSLGPISLQESIHILDLTTNQVISP